MNKNKKDMALVALLIVGIIGVWIFLYSDGILDKKLPDSIKKETVVKKIKKVKEVLPEIKKKEEVKSVKEKEGEKVAEIKENPIVVFETSQGDFEIELYKKLMPITAGNFEKLVKEKFYDNQRFHRIIKDFMIQAGDPNSKDLTKKQIWGTGGPGYAIKDEHIKNEKLTNKEYTISMANSGPNSGGSQFFINTVDNLFLDFDKQPMQSKHPVFGKVIKGFEVVDKIEGAKNGEVIIKKVYIKK